MKCEITKDELVIRIPVNKKPSPSASGKTLVVATTSGFQDAGCEFDGKPVKLSLNATIKNSG